MSSSLLMARFWSCPRLTPAGRCESFSTPEEVDETWQPLGQSWAPEASFAPRAWAQVRWCEDFLQYDVVLTGRAARNRARRLNERTWELGEVCEIFLKLSGRPDYLEVHVTPENHRLQLLFPIGAIEHVRAGWSRLDDYLVSYPEWVESATLVEADFWAVRVRIPALRLRLSQFGPQQALQTAVCRYDCTSGPEPVLSSTAAFRELSFHRVADWTPLVLTASAPR